MLIHSCICDFQLFFQDFMGWFPLSEEKFNLYSETASISLPTVTGCDIFVINLCKGKEAEQLLNIGLIWDYMSHSFAGKPLVVSSCSFVWNPGKNFCFIVLLSYCLPSTGALKGELILILTQLMTQNNPSVTVICTLDCGDTRLWTVAHGHIIMSLFLFWSFFFVWELFYA